MVKNRFNHHHLATRLKKRLEEFQLHKVANEFKSKIPKELLDNSEDFENSFC